MKEVDFTDFLNKYKDCLQDVKKLRTFLCDIFPEEPLMTDLLLDLYQMGICDDIKKTNPIDDILYFRYKKKLVQRKGTKDDIAEEAVALWIKSYGKGVLRHNVSISTKTPSVKIPNEGIKVKTFENCTFKVTLPKVNVSDGFVYLEFKIQSKVGISVDVVLDEIYLSDTLGRKYDSKYDDLFKPKENLAKDILAKVPIKGKNFLRSNCSLVLYFLAGDGLRYEIAYISTKESGICLDYVMAKHMSDEEQMRFQEIIGKIDGDANGNPDDPVTPPETTPIPQIEEYKNAILREKYFIQNDGGRKYRVTAGKRLLYKNGLSTYSFELEAELNLSDDAPITLTVSGGSALGSVLLCEGFQIIVTVDGDFGNTIGQGFISVEPWKLLEALVKKLDLVTSKNAIAMRIINDGPKLATDKPATEIAKGQANVLNKVKNEVVTVVWGPPGTGKTYTMGQIAIDALKKGKSVLVVSHSNVSVDGIVKQTINSLRKNSLDDMLKDGRILRYGYVRDDELAQEDHVVAYNYALLHRPDIKTRMDRLNAEKEKLKKTGGFNSPKGEEIERELKKLRTEVKAEERGYIEKADFVATTISKVTVDPVFDGKEYDIVMFDEVSMAYVPQIICAAMYAKEKMVLVGDFRQLSPIVQSEAKKVLEVDIFAYLGISKGGNVWAHPWLVMLNEQRRMHPLISGFANRFVYGNLLEDHDSVQSNRADVVSREPLSGNAVNMVNLAGTYCAAMKNTDNSRFNVLSAIVSFLTALQAEESGETSIGIITPYAAQTRLVRAMIQDHRKNEETGIVCSTVHQFQGSERNLIVFDAIESYPAPKIGFLMGKGMYSVTRLINVAVTRAKGKIILIANAKFWENKFGNEQHIVWKLISYIRGSGNEVAVQDKALSSYITQLPFTKNICDYVALEDAIEDFGLDVNNAHDKIVISIPDGELDIETQNEVLKIIENASQRGIHVLCKTKDYASLPEGWKSITWASENAIFPMIIIDDKILWYGFPKSSGRFHDGTTTYKTVCQTVYRIQGEHTIETIKAFSEFETREVNGNKTPLIPKTGLIGGDGTGTAGLDAFIHEKEKCVKCKSPMKLAKGATGKFFMRCTSKGCNETKMLTREFVDWYIMSRHVNCPIHNCDIEAKIGKYGLYIKCDMGHNLKLDEI